MLIGASVTNSSFEGEIKEVRVWNEALSEAEILDNYDNPTLTGTETGLVGYWNFDGTSVVGNTIKDIAATDNNLNLDFLITS